MHGSEYGQPGTISLYDPVYDQPGSNLSLLWQSMINLSLYGRRTATTHINRNLYQKTKSYIRTVLKSLS